jgi:hypothetical protein
LTFFLVLSIHCAASAQQTQPTLEIFTGIDYSVGDYGAASDTTVFGVPVGLKMQADRLRGDLTISYLSLEGPGAFVGGPGGPVVVEPGTGQTTTRSGLGDTIAGAAFAFYRSADARSAVEVGGMVKLPTAKSGLGTGKTDFTALLSFYHPLTPQLILSGAAGYQWLGDFQNFQLKDGFLGNIGLNIWPNQTTAIGGTLNYRQEPWAGIGEQVSVAPYLLHRFAGNWGVTVYGTVGLTEASPSLGTGLRLFFYQ